MCGILASFSKEHTQYNINYFEQCLKLMNNRGPDSKGVKIFKNCILGNTRLKTIDSNDNSNMPFRSMHQDIWITFNGVIYNYSELKDMLIKKGVKFFTDSDTEVIVNMYFVFGPGFENS